MSKTVCDHCGIEVEENWILCPNCGARLRRESGRSPIRTWAGRLTLTAFLAILIILGFGAAGVYQGLRERDRLIREAAEEHYALGIVCLEEGKYELAVAEFEQALLLAPGHQKAEAKLAEAKSRLKAMGTPVLEAQSRLAESLYNEAQNLHSQGSWSEAIHKLEQLRSLDPHYKPQKVEELLYDSFYRYGLQLVDENRLEEALRSFDRALELRPDAPEASVQRQWAALYLNALSYWGADWEKSIENLVKLCKLAPNYKDAKRRLFEAYVNLGDIYANREEWCSAEKQYAKALQLRPDQNCQEKRAKAHQRCLIGVASSSITATAIPLDSIAGLNTGKIVFTLHNEQGKAQGIFLVCADGFRKVKAAEGATQPALSPDGTRIAFRAKGNIWTANIEGSGKVMIAGSSGGIHPSWSPDGQMVAFAVRGDDQRWHIYASPADGQGEAEEMVLGWSPAWGPQGWFAYTGCDENENCGIWVVKGEAKPLRLTADPHDIGLAWSPDGKQLAYMSDHDGDWNIYTVTVPGGYVKRLTDDPGCDGLPAWSPDGGYIAFVSDRDGSWGIYLMRPDGSEQKKIFDLGAEYPDWLEDRISWGK